MTDEKLHELREMARTLRLDIVELVRLGPPGHLGGSCSCADIMAAIYFYKLRYDPKNPKWPERDIFMMSKGHGVLAQYSALIELGVIARAAMETIKTIGATLQCHPDMNKTPGVEVNTGSLGQGLSVALGLALAARLDKSPRRVYCVVGDGELDEGQMWEAMNAAAVHNVDNLVGIVDHNKLKASGRLREVYDTGNLSAKISTFGWKVIDIDGHDMEQIVTALDFAETVKGRPTMIVAHTVKAKGVRFAENLQPFHHCILSDDQYGEAVCCIKEAL